jgi:DNA recombination protein RmuC
MNLIGLITLFTTVSVVGLIVGWLIAKSKYSSRFSSALFEYRTQIACLSETLRTKTEELSDARSTLAQSKRELQSANLELLESAKERSAALGKLDHMEDLKASLKLYKKELKTLNEMIANLKRRQAKLETIIVKERIAAEEKIALLKDIRSNMTDTYKAISASALRENNQSFLDLAETTLSKYMEAAKKDIDARGKEVKDIVHPIHNALHKYDEHIQAMERAREKAYGGLSQQLLSLVRTQDILQKETGKLLKALRIPQVRGRWGEITLKRVAELSGMLNQCDFFEQPTTLAEEGFLRPDMLVYLPGGRQVVVDAKVPLAAYLEALEAETDEECDAMLLTHAKHVQSHIHALARKTYWAQFEQAPEFVVLFIPGESFFSAALAKNPHLIEEGINKNVILATPTTLISLLKTIAFGWRQEAVAENAKTISELGRELYDRLYSMTKHVNRLGREIERCTTTYNQVIGSFEHRVFASARKFKELGLYLKDGRELLFINPAEKKARRLEVENKP